MVTVSLANAAVSPQSALSLPCQPARAGKAPAFPKEAAVTCKCQRSQEGEGLSPSSFHGWQERHSGQLCPRGLGKAEQVSVRGYVRTRPQGR